MIDDANVEPSDSADDTACDGVDANSVIMDIVTNAEYPQQAGWKSWGKIGTS